MKAVDKNDSGEIDYSGIYINIYWNLCFYLTIN
jgi:hypothetical protein